MTRVDLLLPLSLLPLASLQEILGGPHAAEQKYDAEFFKKFRSQNIIVSATNYARVPPLHSISATLAFMCTET